MEGDSTRIINEDIGGKDMGKQMLHSPAKVMKAVVLFSLYWRLPERNKARNKR